MIVKHMTILTLMPTALTGIIYFHKSEGDTVETHALPENVWREMGSPNEITVTTQPGNLLNEEKE